MSLLEWNGYAYIKRSLYNFSALKGKKICHLLMNKQLYKLICVQHDCYYNKLIIQNIILNIRSEALVA